MKPETRKYYYSLIFLVPYFLGIIFWLSCAVSGIFLPGTFMDKVVAAISLVILAKSVIPDLIDDVSKLGV